MPEIKYCKDYRHNYVIFSINNDCNSNYYQIKMITENVIQGLITCQERHINGDFLLYYDITSQKNLLHSFEVKSLGLSEIQKMFVQIKVVCDQLQKYLLSEKGLLMSPEFIYLNMETNDYCFLYYPQDEDTDFSKLVDFLLAKVDHEDKKAVELIYKMADLVQRDQFAMDEVLNWFGMYTEECAKASITADSIEEPIRLETDDEEEENLSIWEKIFFRIFSFKRKRKPVSKKRNSNIYVPTFEENEPKYETGTENTIFVPWSESCENKLYGMDKGNKHHIDLNHLPLTVGKMAGAVDLVIPEQSISRIHARFSSGDRGILLTDVNSTNGCFKNGIRLEPNASEIIEPGDEIKLGKLKFIYR